MYNMYSKTIFQNRKLLKIKYIIVMKNKMKFRQHKTFVKNKNPITHRFLLSMYTLLKIKMAYYLLPFNNTVEAFQCQWLWTFVIIFNTYTVFHSIEIFNLLSQLSQFCHTTNNVVINIFVYMYLLVTLFS